MIPQSISIAAYLQRPVLPNQNDGHVNYALSNKQSNTKPMDWTFEMSFKSYHQQSPPEEIIKSHRFHYGRYRRSRKRIFIILLFKILLLITHVGVLLHSLIHILH